MPARILLPTLSAATLVLGCAGGKEPPSYPARQPTAGNAVLPETPDLNPKLPPAQYEDGAWSVYGVTSSASAGRNDDAIAVRGYVAELHPCADRAKGCKPAPHLLLTDREDLQGRRLLVGGDFDPGRDNLAKGKVATLRGLMVRSDRDGLYFAPTGLLLLQPPPPPEADAAP